MGVEKALMKICTHSQTQSGVENCGQTHLLSRASFRFQTASLPVLPMYNLIAFYNYPIR